jgi:hypothetical protein
MKRLRFKGESIAPIGSYSIIVSLMFAIGHRSHSPDNTDFNFCSALIAASPRRLRLRLACGGQAASQRDSTEPRGPAHTTPRKPAATFGAPASVAVRAAVIVEGEGVDLVPAARRAEPVIALDVVNAQRPVEPHRVLGH